MATAFSDVEERRNVPNGCILALWNDPSVGLYSVDITLETPSVDVFLKCSDLSCEEVELLYRLLSRTVVTLY